MHYPSFLFLLRQIFSWKFIFHLDVKKKFFLYSYFRLRWTFDGLFSSCGAQASHCGALSCSSAWTLGWVFVGLWLWSSGSALAGAGLVAPGHGGCSGSRIEPASAARAASSPLSLQGRTPACRLFDTTVTQVRRFCYF